MPKLITPVQYEPSIERLNDIRPLQLEDEVKIVIACPVLYENPPSENKPAVGKLARCTKQGALLADRQKVYTNFEYITQDFETGDENQVIQFSQKVSFVQSRAVALGTWLTAVWTDPTYTITLKDIRSPYTEFLPFNGVDLYVRVTCSLPGFITTIGFHGFY